MPTRRQGKAGRDGEAAVGVGAGGEVAAVEVDALAHADEPMAGVVAVVARGGAEAIVADLQPDLVVAVLDQDPRCARAGVADGVGQCLLDDPVGGQVHARRQGTGLALDLEFRLETGLADLLDQGGQLLQAWLGREARVAVVAGAEHAGPTTNG